MAIIVRDARPSDATIIAEFNARLAQETEGKILDCGELARGVAALISDPAKGRYFLACDGDDVLGQVALSFEWSDWRDGWFWWLQSVYVRADARGRGVFRTLHQHVIDAARAAGALGLRLYVERDNENGKRTYEALGMTPTSYLVFEQLLHGG
jgi:GNAT superfamily N-acetyltransferase